MTIATIVQPTYDNSIKPSTNTTYPWNASTGLIDVNFAGTIGTTNAIQFIKDGYQFAWKPDTVEVLDDQGNLTAVSTVNPNATAQVWKNRLTYVGTTPLTSDEFEVQGNQLKHTVRMVAPPSLPSGYTGNPQFLAIGGDIGTTAQDWNDIDLYADGVSHRSDFTTTDDLRFVRIADGVEIYRIPRITVIDANGNETLGEYKLVFQPNNVVTLYLLVPWNWMQSAAYPVAIDPTVVVSSAYDTSGNGGRKIVRLSNNWIVAVAFNSSNGNSIFYVSKDNGQTWAQLCYIANGTSAQDTVSMASSGTIIYSIHRDMGQNGIGFASFDASTITNVNVYATPTLVDANQTALGTGTSLATDSTGALHATWASKNSTYPNSFNIRYSKGTVSGTTVTWATPTQITSWNTNGTDGTNPCIVIDSTNKPHIILQYYSSIGGAYALYAYNWNGTAWDTTGKTVYSSVYTQQNPCAAIDGNGIIYAVWDGEDSSESSINEIRYSKSTDGGSTWSPMTKLTSGSAGSQWSPSITIDPNNNLYVFFHGMDPAVSTSYNNIRKIVYNAGSWGSVSTITNGTTGGVVDAQTLWSEFNMNSSDAIRYIYSDHQSGAVKYDAITLNNPPNAPTLNAHENFDATTAQTLTWTFSDPNTGDTQSAYQLQIYDTSNTSTPVVDTGKVGQSTTTQNQTGSYALAASKLSNGKSYQWRVTTWDSSGAQGPWSSYSTFSTSQAPVATVTSPSSGGSVTSDSYTFTGSYSQAQGVVEQSFQFKLWDSAGSNVLQDSGTITGTSNSKTFSSLANNTSYKIEFIVTSQDGVSASSGLVSFSVSYTPPAVPTVSVTNNYSNATVSVSFTNPTPGTGQPTVTSNSIYRRKTGTSTWTLVASSVTSSPYTDYTCPYGSYDYGVTASSSSGATSGYGTTTVQSQFAGEHLIDESNSANNIVFLYNQVKADQDVKQNYTPVVTFAKYPRVRKSQARYRTGTLTALYVPSSSDVQTQIDAVDAMCNSDNTYILKRNNGYVYRVSLSDLKVNTQYGNQVGNVSVTWTEVGDV